MILRNQLSDKSRLIHFYLETIRVGLYAVIFYLTVASQLLQPYFINTEFVTAFYFTLFLGFLCHSVYVIQFEKFIHSNRWLMLSFVIDAILISALVFKSGLNQSLLLFLYLVNIILCGFLFQIQGALKISLLTAIFFNIITIVGPETKGVSLLFVLFLNNISFFAVAWISGFSSEQFNLIGAELETQKKSFKKLNDKNKFIIDHMPTGLMTLTLDGEVAQCNSAALRILNLQNTNEMPQDFIRHILNSVGENQTRRYDFIFNKENDSKKILQMTISRLEDSQLDSSAVSVLFDDATQIRQLENQVRQSEKMAAVGQLAAGIAHEIRNPLAGISGSVEMLSQTTQDDDDKKLMKIILREIDRLNNLITEFLDFAKPAESPTDKVSLQVVLEDCLQNLQNNSTLNKNVQILKEFQNPGWILGDSSKLKQAFLNMLINAYHALDNVENPKISISLKSESGNQLLTIRDNGAGMTEKTQKRLFEAFYTTKSKGTGLGLAMTHKIFENHQAQIQVISQVGSGTEFKIYFKDLVNKSEVLRNKEML